MQFHTHTKIAQVIASHVWPFTLNFSHPEQIISTSM